MKILCLCNHGNVRSAALVRAIKDDNGPCLRTDQEYLDTYIKNEAIAIGAHCSQQETIKLLVGWADKVFDLSDEDKKVNDMIKGFAPEKYVRVDIGLDRWLHPFHPELITIIKKVWGEIK